MASLARINLTPVKGLALEHPACVELGAAGVESNRRFYLTCGGLLYNGKDHGPLVAVHAEFADGALSLRFPDGAEVAAEPALGAAVETNFWGRTVAGRLVQGPWAEALSSYTGEPIELVQADAVGAASDVCVGTIIGRGSCERLAEELSAPVDPRRFRMLFELEGLAPHEEDSWSGRLVRVGEAVVSVGGPVPRCAITTQDPDTGTVSLDTLRAIGSYRGRRDGRWIDFGVYFDVAEPGLVRVGDRVEPL